MSENLNITALLGSPRRGGNSETLLSYAVKTVKEAGHEITVFRADELDISPCLHCGGCDNDGLCVIDDGMSGIYDAIRTADRIIIATPVFFFGLPAQLKAVIDRCQSFWVEKYRLNRPIEAGASGRMGLLITVGGLKMEIGYRCCEATAKAFFRSISVPEHVAVSFPGIDEKGAILENLTAEKDVISATLQLLNGVKAEP